MIKRLDYTENGRAYRFNLNTFTSEIYPQGKPNGVSMIDAVTQYFDLSGETMYCESCMFSRKFKTYILPVENHVGERNFLMIKNDKIFNPNEFAGFALGDSFLENPYFVSDLEYAKENSNWIYFSVLDKKLVDFVIEKYKISPQYEDNFSGKILKLLSSIPESWKYDNHYTLRVSSPSIEDRTTLINLLPDEDFIEFEKEIVILLNLKNTEILAKHCLTLYSTI